MNFANHGGRATQLLQSMCTRAQMLNIMKGAIQTSHAITTVSESYAWEITQPSHGVGLHVVLARAAHRLIGIVNGIDLAVWDPATDAHLPFNYSASDMRGKGACKAMLRRELGLPEPSFDVDVPIVAFVGRLDPQKGSDVLIDALPGLLSLDCQVRARALCADTTASWLRDKLHAHNLEVADKR